ncbi:MAG: glycosyltransferase family 1 protein [Chloroflexota bacterium]|nr:MAG: glycosyltransferase family 1 protein [Chloroflexota bacterium]
MRVAILSKAMLVGAYQRKAEEIAAIPGVELTVFVPPRWSGPVASIERVFTRGYDLRVLPVAFGGHYHVHFYPTLGRELATLRPDLFHVDEEPYNLATFHAYLAGGRVGAARVFFTWQNIDKTYPPPFGWIEPWIIARSDGVIAGVTDAAAIVRRKGFRGPLAVIPQFGIDPDLFSPPLVRPPGPFSIGFLGRIEAYKGVLDLVDACSGLTVDWRLTFVGEGPASSEVIARAAGLGVSDRVTIRPPVPSTEVPEVYRSLDAIALPSRTTPRWKEQFGRVLTEGMACGAIPVGSDSGEIPTVIGDAGFVFPEGDAAALRDRLTTIAVDQELAATLRRRGRERAMTHYTQRAIAAQTVELYHQALAGRRS